MIPPVPGCYLRAVRPCEVCRLAMLRRHRALRRAIRATPVYQDPTIMYGGLWRPVGGVLRPAC